jgi:hypothetical protein
MSEDSHKCKVETSGFMLDVMPHPKFVVAQNRYVAVALTKDQAEDAFKNYLDLVLCVEPPRAQYCRSYREAIEFFYRCIYKEESGK